MKTPLPRPLCRCHGVEMYVNSGGRNGGWRCKVKVRERQTAPDRENWRKRNGWYDENGMATKPLQVKELMPSG